MNLFNFIAIFFISILALCYAKLMIKYITKYSTSITNIKKYGIIFLSVTYVVVFSLLVLNLDSPTMFSNLAIAFSTLQISAIAFIFLAIFDIIIIKN